MTVVEALKGQQLRASAQSNLPRLTSLRAFAALAVFVFHLDRWDVASLPVGVSELGYLGVGFFFVLSGFILAWSTRPGLPAKTFYRRRFARIYPSHVVVLLIALAVPLAAGSRDFVAVLANLTLTQGWWLDSPTVYGGNGVAWSLSCEVFFYLTFPLAVVVLPRLSSKLQVALCGSALAMELLASVMSPAIAYHNPLLRYPEFLLGLVAGLAVRRGWRPTISRTAAASFTFTVLGLVALAHAMLPAQVETGSADAIMAVPFLAVILAATRADLESRPGLLRHRVTEYAGEVSFAFYLVHELILMNLTPVLPDVPVLQVFVIGAAAAVAAAALHSCVEKPANQWLRTGRRSVRNRHPALAG